MRVLKATRCRKKPSTPRPVFLEFLQGLCPPIEAWLSEFCRGSGFGARSFCTAGCGDAGFSALLWFHWASWVLEFGG